MNGAHLDVGTSPRSVVRILTADGAARGVMHPRGRHAVVTGDVHDETFRVGGETREWVEGKAFAFDDSIDHEAWNQSGELRAVLIIDTWNPHLSEREQAAIAAYFAAADQALDGAGAT